MGGLGSIRSAGVKSDSFFGVSLVIYSCLSLLQQPKFKLIVLDYLDTSAMVLLHYPSRLRWLLDSRSMAQSSKFQRPKSSSLKPRMLATLLRKELKEKAFFLRRRQSGQISLIFRLRTSPSWMMEGVSSCLQFSLRFDHSLLKDFRACMFSATLDSQISPSIREVPSLIKDFSLPSTSPEVQLLLLSLSLLCSALLAVGGCGRGCSVILSILRESWMRLDLILAYSDISLSSVSITLRISSFCSYRSCRFWLNSSCALLNSSISGKTNMRSSLRKVQYLATSDSSPISFSGRQTAQICRHLRNSEQKFSLSSAEASASGQMSLPAASPCSPGTLATSLKISVMKEALWATTMAQTCPCLTKELNRARQARCCWKCLGTSESMETQRFIAGIDSTASSLSISFRVLLLIPCLKTISSFSFLEIKLPNASPLIPLTSLKKVTRKACSYLPLTSCWTGAPASLRAVAMAWKREGAGNSA